MKKLLMIIIFLSVTTLLNAKIVNEGTVSDYHICKKTFNDNIEYEFGDKIYNSDKIDSQEKFDKIINSIKNSKEDSEENSSFYIQRTLLNFMVIIAIIFIFIGTGMTIKQDPSKPFDVRENLTGIFVLIISMITFFILATISKHLVKEHASVKNGASYYSNSSSYTNNTYFYFKGIKIPVKTSKTFLKGNQLLDEEIKYIDVNTYKDCTNILDILPTDKSGGFWF